MKKTLKNMMNLFKSRNISYDIVETVEDNKVKTEVKIQDTEEAKQAEQAYQDHLKEKIHGKGYKLLQEIKSLNELQKSEKLQRKTVNFPENVKRTVDPETAQYNCFERKKLLRIMYKVYADIKNRQNKQIGDPNFEQWAKSYESYVTYGENKFSRSAKKVYEEIFEKYSNI